MLSGTPQDGDGQRAWQTLVGKPDTQFCFHIDFGKREYSISYCKLDCNIDLSTEHTLWRPYWTASLRCLQIGHLLKKFYATKFNFIQSDNPAEKVFDRSLLDIIFTTKSQSPQMAYCEDALNSIIVCTPNSNDYSYVYAHGGQTYK